MPFLTDDGTAVLWLCRVCGKSVRTAVRLENGPDVWSEPPSGWLVCDEKIACSKECAEKSGRRLRSAWVSDPLELCGRRWSCPNCGGDRFGSDEVTFYCKGSGDTMACGYWEKIFVNEHGIHMQTLKP